MFGSDNHTIIFATDKNFGLVDIKQKRLHGYTTEFSTHPRHQPAATWMNTTRYCKYSQVLLMMGKNIAQNM
jgi:hypothetical protein